MKLGGTSLAISITNYMVKTFDILWIAVYFPIRTQDVRGIYINVLINYTK